MIEEWMNQIQHLSKAQAGLLYVLSLLLLLLAYISRNQRGDDNV